MSNEIKKIIKYFTLIEVLLALAILSITFTVILTSLRTNIKNASVASGYINAFLLFQSLYNKIILDTSLMKTGITRGDFGNKFPGYSWQVEVIEDVKQEDEKSSFKVADIEVFFIRGGQKRSVFFKSMKFETKSVENKKDKSLET
jgi:prepilin-type N-terminal cleavage/methylation domain-containing protein